MMIKKEKFHTKKNDEEICYQCEMTRHWSRVCHTSKHLVDIYQASLERENGKM